MPRVVKFKKTGSRMVVSRDSGEGKLGVVCLMSKNFSFMR